MRTLASNQRQGIIALILVVMFAWLGVYFGASPDSVKAGNFGAVISAFATEQQTRTIVAAIMIDVVTGVIAALRVGTFDTQRLASFMASNVLPYLLGYMLFWFLTYYGMADLVPSGVDDALTSLGYGAVMASLTVSIADNLARAQAGTTPPHDAIIGNLPPAEPHA